MLYILYFLLMHVVQSSYIMFKVVQVSHGMLRTKMMKVSVENKSQEE